MAIDIKEELKKQLNDNMNNVEELKARLEED